MDTPTTATSQPPLLTRKDAVAHARKKHGIQVSPRTLEKWPVPYQVVAGRSMYVAADIDAFFAALIAAAPRRGGTSRQTAPMRGRGAKSAAGAASAVA